MSPRKPKTPLTASIVAPAGPPDAPPPVGAHPAVGETYSLILRITNPSDRAVSVLNPDMGVPSPDMHWPYSQAVYQTSLLLSYGYLTLAVTDEAGRELPPEAIQTWATPVLRPRIELEPGAAFEVTIPIGAFYHLEPGQTYRLALTYGDRELKVPAKARVIAP